MLLNFVETSNHSVQYLKTAAFRCWVPDNISKIKYIVTGLAGVNHDTRNFAEDIKWQDFAQKFGCILIGCFFEDEREGQAAYCITSRGSGRILLNAVKYFAREINQLNLINKKFLMWGVSAGGQFNYSFAYNFPYKVAAFIVNKGGRYYEYCKNEKKIRKMFLIPALFIIGSQDKEERINIIKQIYSQNNINDNWSLICEDNCEHDICNSEKIALSFFENII